MGAARTQQAGNAYNPYGAILQGAGSNQALNSWFQNQINKPNYDNWQTSGDNTYFGSNSSGQGAGGSADFNASIGL
jgi:asparagine synthetase A